MNKVLFLTASVALLSVISCNSGDNIPNKDLEDAQDSIAMLVYEISEKDIQISDLQLKILDFEQQISNLELKIDTLKFPADQRLAQIKSLIEDNKFNEARDKIAELEKWFPISPEAGQCDALVSQIEAKEEAIRVEQERIKALGFKALPVKTTAEIGPNQVTFSNITNKREFIHDSYSTYSGSSYFYNTADRDNTFMVADMSVTSTDKNPKLPTLAVYAIEGDILKIQDVMIIKFARWDDYSTYLGNEPDLKNDFAKVSTIRFKLGCEISEDILKKPYMVVLKLENTQSRNYDGFKNPPYWYSGFVDYPSTLTLDDFNTGYQVVKIANLK